MLYFSAAAALLLHTFWWGLGLALLATPRSWRPAWPLFVPVAGFFLQTTVVWLGVQADLPGTRSYAWISQALPLLLLVLACVRRPGRRPWSAWRATAAVWVLVGVVTSLLILPLSRTAHELTTLSLGSCDAADYAAGARVMREFAASDRSGFLGLTEVVQLHSVDNFLAHFTRLNHFAPSALLAHHGAIFGWEPYEITGILTAVFLASSLPLVFWIARASLRMPAAAAGALAAIYGLSPLTWYAVAHVAMSQLLAAQAVALLTATALGLWRSGARRQERGGFALMLFISLSLMLAAYHFIIVVAWVPAVTLIGFEVLQQRKWAAFGRWLVVTVAAVGAASLLYAGRVAGLVERFMLFQEYDFGWPIRLLTPEGWLGWVEAPAFEPAPAWLRVLVSSVVVAAVVVAFRRSDALRRQRMTAMALTVPILVGYAFLQWRGWRYGTNASYDAYKLLSVFFPGVLAVAGGWLVLWYQPRGYRLVALVLTLMVLAGNVGAVVGFSQHLRHAPFIVDQPLVALRQIESYAEVRSVNLRMHDMWSRLWANVFLLRKPHYFSATTYEGRRATELKGEWDLSSGIVVIHNRQNAAEIGLPEPFELRRRGSEGIVVTLGEGWYGLERLPQSSERWRWTAPDAALWVENPHHGPRVVRLQIDASSAAERELQLWQDSHHVGSAWVGPERSQLIFSDVLVASGRTRLRLVSPQPGVVPGGGDTRSLLACVYRIVFDVSPTDT